MESTATAFDVLSAMITPAVLISASGMLVLSTSNRLSRVVDRTRALAEKVSKLEHKETEVLEQVQYLGRRVLLLRSAMTSLYTAISLFVATSIAVGIVSALGWKYAWAPVLIELIGAVSLLYASLLLIQEARLAVASTLGEMTAVRETVQRLQKRS